LEYREEKSTKNSKAPGQKNIISDQRPKKTPSRGPNAGKKYRRIRKKKKNNE